MSRRIDSRRDQIILKADVGVPFLGKDKINLALLWPSYGDNVTSVNDLVLGLDRKRFNVIFVYLTGYGVERNLIEEAGYKVFYLSNIRLINTFRFSILLKLIRILREHNVDILHCNSHKPSFYGALAGTFAKTPVVLSHVHGLNRTRNRKRRLANFFLFKRIHRIIAIAEKVKEDILMNNWRLSAEKVHVLENSVDYGRFSNPSTSRLEARKILGLSAHALVFGTVGRLAPTKGQSYLIKAFAEVKQELPESVLLLAGAGRLEDTLKAEASRTGFGKSIHFLGRRTDIPQILKALDVFVLPSVAEGFGLALAEAMAAGVPCIATQVGGIPEILPNRDVGRLVPARDANALAAAMIDLAQTPSDRLEQLAALASDRVRRLYSHEVVREKLAHLYESELAISQDTSFAFSMGEGKG